LHATRVLEPLTSVLELSDKCDAFAHHTTNKIFKQQ